MYLDGKFVDPRAVGYAVPIGRAIMNGEQWILLECKHWKKVKRKIVTWYTPHRCYKCMTAKRFQRVFRNLKMKSGDFPSISALFLPVKGNPLIQ